MILDRVSGEVCDPDDWRFTHNYSCTGGVAQTYVRPVMIDCSKLAGLVDAFERTPPIGVFFICVCFVPSWRVYERTSAIGVCFLCFGFPVVFNTRIAWGSCVSPRVCYILSFLFTWFSIQSALATFLFSFSLVF